MRIDLTYGTETNRIDHLPSEIAAILLGHNISRKTYGSEVNWIYVVTRAKPGKKEPKTCWRWPKSRSTHVVVENDCEFATRTPLREAIIALLDSLKNTVLRVSYFLGEQADFDKKRLIKAIDKTIDECPSNADIAILAKNISRESRRRMGEVIFGNQAFRALKKHECDSSLAWVRTFEAGTAAAALGKPQRQQLNIVGAMLGAALRRKIMTPGYSEIFINFGFDEVEVRSERCALEDWCENAYAILPDSILSTKDDASFRQLAFAAAKNALLEMAKHEDLDGKAISKLSSEIDVVSLATCFQLDHASSNNLSAAIEYDFAHRKDSGAILQPLFRLNVANTDTGKNKVFPLGPADLWKMERIFSKISIKPKSGTIEIIATKMSGAKSQTFDISPLL